MTCTARRTPVARRILLLIVGALLVAAGFACGPEVSPEQMGDVVFKVPEIPDTEEPFPLPELEGAEAAPTGDTEAAPTGDTGSLDDPATQPE